MINILWLAVGLVVGVILGYFGRKMVVGSKTAKAEEHAETILNEARQKEKELLIEAKSKALEITESTKKDEQEFREQMKRFQDRLDKREKDLDRDEQAVQNSKQDLEKKRAEVTALQDEMKEVKAKQLATLEKIAGLSKEEAGKVLMENAERGLHEELAGLHRKIVTKARENADREAKQIIASALERVHTEVTSEHTTTSVQIPSEDMKGRIIGKEGRNIRAFEQLMGVEILIDDQPDSVVISGFNSIRRHVAKLTLEKLLADGRIHPARIEEAYEKSKAEINEVIKQAGEQAVYELGITNFPAKLVHLVGRLVFRTSYGQNVLNHSVEMAKIGALIADDLGADASVVKQGALLHDIGKALDQDMEGTHIELGRRVAEKFGLDHRVIEAIESHHHDTDVSENAKHNHDLSLEAMIVDCADGISGGRPGARKDSYENYVKRLTDLENIANSFDGVDKTYAIMGGRELRIFVKPQKLDDYASQKLARAIANRIQSELKFPGEIRVQVIREMRVVEYAR